MAKKTFKGGLDSLIENSLGIKKLKGKKTEFKGNPVDLEDKEEKQQQQEDEKPEEETTAEVETPKEEEVTVPVAPVVSLENNDNDSESIAYLKNMIHDLRHELFLWRNGKIDVQIFNQSLHLHNLKYNPENNEIEEF